MWGWEGRGGEVEGSLSSQLITSEVTTETSGTEMCEEDTEQKPVVLHAVS